ncbi:MAG: FkbM family methyltransferase [Actinobacteria bacterium]|nr:FkbM family methyltransferase [Actinomycetota bacterium]MBM4102394.1 FkbM family methyltransferase [Phycisphaerae bacterium]
MSGIKQRIKRLATGSFDKQVADLVAAIIDSGKIALLDVGAANGTYGRWSAFSHHIDHFAVEPDARSSQGLARSATDSTFNSQTLITKALWKSTGTIKLNLCRKPMASSIYEPNREFFDLFPDAERNDVLNQVELPSDTVDNIARELGARFDVIKLDVQGAELDVLEGATKSLGDALAIDIEVEFTELYKGQPLFDDIFRFLRSHEIEFVDFTYIYRWSPDSYNGIGQATFADALFMPTPERIGDSANVIRIKKYALVCAIFERGDMLLRLSKSCSKNSPNDLAQKIKTLGDLLTQRNSTTQRRLNFAAKVIRLFHPRFRAHILH